MAEFLVYNKVHWRDVDNNQEVWRQKIDNDTSLDSVAKTKKLQIHEDKYNARYQKGDYIEIQEDGFWTDGRRKGWGAPDFALVCMPGIEAKDVKYLLIPRYKSVVKEYNCPKMDFSGDLTMGVFNSIPTIIQEYKVLTEVPLLGMVYIDWVKLSGTADQMDRKKRYRTNINLGDGSKIMLQNMSQMQNIDKV